MSSKCCKDASETLKCWGNGCLILLGFCLLVSTVCAPFIFAFRTMPKYRNYIDEEQHHVIRMCTNITIRDKGKKKLTFF